MCLTASCLQARANSPHKTNTNATAQAAGGWDAWVDKKFLTETLDEFAIDVGKGMGEFIGKRTQKLQREIEALRHQVTELRNEIRTLEQRRAIEQSIVSWHVSRRSFSAVPFDRSGRAGPALNLRGLFEEYQQQTS
jgi:hypothetical protein